MNNKSFQVNILGGCSPSGGFQATPGNQVPDYYYQKATPQLDASGRVQFADVAADTRPDNLSAQRLLSTACLDKSFRDGISLVSTQPKRPVAAQIGVSQIPKQLRAFNLQPQYNVEYTDNCQYFGSSGYGERDHNGMIRISGSGSLPKRYYANNGYGPETPEYLGCGSNHKFTLPITRSTGPVYSGNCNGCCQKPRQIPVVKEGFDDFYYTTSGYSSDNYDNSPPPRCAKRCGGVFLTQYQRPLPPLKQAPPQLSNKGCCGCACGPPVDFRGYGQRGVYGWNSKLGKPAILGGGYCGPRAVEGFGQFGGDISTSGGQPSIFQGYLRQEGGLGSSNPASTTSIVDGETIVKKPPNLAGMFNFQG